MSPKPEFIMSKKFKHPVIIGALCEREKDVPKELERVLKKCGKKIAFIKFVTKPRHLKNMLACMRLMDVHSLYIAGSLRLKIARNLRHFLPNDLKLKAADVIVRMNGKFCGINAVEAAVIKWMSQKASISRCCEKTSKEEAMGLFCQTTASLLTSSLKL